MISAKEARELQENPCVTNEIDERKVNTLFSIFVVKGEKAIKEAACNKKNKAKIYYNEIGTKYSNEVRVEALRRYIRRLYENEYIVKVEADYHDEDYLAIYWNLPDKKTLWEKIKNLFTTHNSTEI